jgi:hypothetical protein
LIQFNSGARNISKGARFVRYSGNIENDKAKIQLFTKRRELGIIEFFI